ncbi:MAG: EI24 domain-containing protein, partial [Dongiaceae bacterium]
MLSAVAQAVAQLNDPRIRRVIWLSVATALAILFGLGLAIWFVVAQLSHVPWSWLDTAIDLATGVGLVLAVWVLFPAAISATIGLFLE